MEEVGWWGWPAGVEDPRSSTSDGTDQSYWIVAISLYSSSIFSAPSYVFSRAYTGALQLSALLTSKWRTYRAPLWPALTLPYGEGVESICSVSVRSGQNHRPLTVLWRSKGPAIKLPSTGNSIPGRESQLATHWCEKKMLHPLEEALQNLLLPMKAGTLILRQHSSCVPLPVICLHTALYYRHWLSAPA